MAPTSPAPYQSPLWGRATKIIVVVMALLLLVALVMRFRTLIGMVVIAAILAYMLDPIISFIDRRTSVRRGIIVLFVYLLLAALLIGGFSALGVATFQQAVTLIDQLPELIEQAAATLSTFTSRDVPLQIGPIVITPDAISWERISEQILGLAEPVIRQGGTALSRVATSTVRTVLNVLFVFVISIYMVNDLPGFSGTIKRFAQQPGYREDAERLLPELGEVWRAYLRGQIVLALVIFVVVWIGLTLLGVQNSLALALLAGLLEFIPNVGPFISTLVAMLVAVFQPSNYLGLAPWQYALAVLGLMLVIQQLENNLLVPRIVGGALNLRPIIVIIGVLMGASLAGILGAILAAPIIASLKVLGSYTWRKLFDLPPFPDDDPPDNVRPHPHWVE